MSSPLRSSVGLKALASLALAGPVLVAAQAASPAGPAPAAPPNGASAASPGAAEPPSAAGGARIVVTGTRSPARADQALAEVDRPQIEAAAGRTLAELLARHAGVIAWANGGRAGPASVSLRGMEARHTLLLIDGVRYGSATLGTPIWDNLPLEAIERIEIVRGPLSGLYGSDAVAGVVQVFTRGGQTGLRPDAAFGVGSQGHRDLSAGLRFGQDGLDGQVRIQHLRSAGFSATNERVPFGQFNGDDDAVRQTSAQARLGLRLGSWRAEALWLGARGTNHYDDGPGADAQADVRTDVQSLGVSGPLGQGWTSSLRLARSQDVNDVRVSASPFSSLGATGTVQRQLSWENQIATPLGSLLALVEHVTQTVQRPGAAYDVSRRSISALALGLNGAAGAHSWQANLRRDRNSQFGSPSTGSVAYGYELLPGLRATASAGSSFVAPSFNQLYFPGFGNPNLLPEKGRHQELGLRWQRGAVKAQLAYYEHRIRGYISSGPLPTNIPRTRIDGLSASVDASLGAWTLGGSFDSLNPLNDTAGSAHAGKLLPRRPTEAARAWADWQRGSLLLGGSIAAFGARFDDAANTRRLPGHALLDLRAETALAPQWTLGLKLNNALDQRYETTFGYNQPGRELFLSLRWAAR
jgi:vitamin B12 transporter